jgi:hypothetical protein
MNGRDKHEFMIGINTQQEESKTNDSKDKLEGFLAPHTGQK